MGGEGKRENRNDSSRGSFFLLIPELVGQPPRLGGMQRGATSCMIATSTQSKGDTERGATSKEEIRGRRENERSAVTALVDPPSFYPQSFSLEPVFLLNVTWSGT